jgi:hypothetical protein
MRPPTKGKTVSKFTDVYAAAIIPGDHIEIFGYTSSVISVTTDPTEEQSVDIVFVFEQTNGDPVIGKVVMPMQSYVRVQILR